MSTVLLLKHRFLELTHYLKSRGIPEKEAYQMLNGFLCEILEKLFEGKIRIS